ncbi:hypothetical protein RCL1_005324 [Eukaryota sp. TZLM3-RCL]
MSESVVSTFRSGPSDKSHYAGVLYKVYSSMGKFNFWSTLLVIVETMQLIAFVSGTVTFHPVFDIQPILRAVSLPFYDPTSSLAAYRISALITISTMVVIGSIYLLVLFLFKSKNAGLPHWVYRITRVYFELLTSVLYIPGMALILTGLNCSPSPIGNPEFITVLSSNCNTSKSFIILGISLILSGLFFLLALLFISCYDSSFTSKRVFARTHHQSHFIMLLVKTFCLGNLFLFHARFWLFRSVYLLGALLVTAAFYYRPPFLSLNSNLLVVGLLGMWSGNGVAFFLYSAFNLRGWNSVVVNTFMFYILMVAGAFGVTFLTFKRFQKHLDLVSSINSTLVVNKFVDEMGKLNIDADIDSIRLSDYDFSITSPYQIDLMTRAIFPKPLSSDLRSTLRIILSYGDFLFPDSLFMKILRLNFELSVTNDPILCASIISVIKKMDIELSFAQEYRLFCLDRQLESLRRAQSTGHNLDSSSFREFQVKQKEFNHLHKECLESLFFFWNSLAAQSVDLSTLPVLLNRVQEGKQKAEGLFNQLIQLQGDHSSVLLSYANFLREVDCDNEKAMFFEEQANLLTSSDQSSHSESSSISGSIALSAKGLAKKQKKRRLGSAVINNLSTGQKSQSKSAIKTLKSSVVIAIIIMFVLSAISWFLSTVILDTARRNVDVLYEASHVQHVGQLLKSKAFEAIFTIDFSGFIESTKNLAQIIATESEHLVYHLRRITLDTETIVNSETCPRTLNREVSPPTEELQSILLTNQFPLFNHQNVIPPRERASVQSFWSLFLYEAFLLAGFSKSVLAEDLSSISTVRGTLASLTSFDGAVDWLYEYIVEFTAQFLGIYLIFQSFFTVLIFSIIIFIGLFLFARSFHFISLERIAILNLFLYIPAKEISKILSHEKFSFIRKKSLRRASINSKLEQENLSDSDSETQEEKKFVQPLIKSNLNNSEQLFVEFPQDSEEEKAPNIVKKSKISPIFRWILITITFILTIAIAILFYNSSNIFEGSSTVSNQFRIAFQARSSGTDTTTTGRTLSSLLQQFSGFGDPYFLAQYTQLLQNDDRNAHMRELLSVGLNEDELRNLGGSQTINRALRYRERIALTLLLSVFDLPDDVLPIPTPLDYSVYDETDVYLDFLKFPEYTNWYTNATFDLSRSPEERLVIAREILSNRRFYELFGELIEVMEGTTAQIVTRRTGILREEAGNLSNLIEIQIIGLSVIAFIFVVTLIVVLYYSRAFVLLFFITFDVSEDTRNLEELAYEGIPLASSAIISGQVFFDFKRFSEQLAYNSHDFRLIPALDAFSRLNQRLLEMSDESSCHDNELYDACTRMARLATSLNDLIDDVAPRYLIAAKLKLAALGLTHLPEFSELDVTWDIPSLSFREQSKWVLPNNLQLTNEADDLALSSEELHELAMAVVSTRDLDLSTNQIVDIFSTLRHFAVEEVTEVLQTETDHITFHIFLVTLLLSFILLSIISNDYYFLCRISSKKRKTYTY